MKPNSDPAEEWEVLIQRFLENEISLSDEKRLNDLLSESPEAQLAFVQACELHSMLEAEPEVRALMGENALPPNVVSLPSNKTGSHSSGEGPSDPVPENFPAACSNHRRRNWMAAAAALVTLCVIGYGILRSLSLPESSLEEQEQFATTPPTEESPEIANEDPETQYERAVLATLGSGSQERPPTNFTVEPSLAGEKISYNRDIRPILSDNCFSCHGPDEHGRKADLRLDTYEGATDSELRTIVPGEPEASELVARIFSKDADETMPPPESHKKLTPAQMDLLTRWITEGAEYEQHWAFLPIDRESETERSSIDGFVDQRLEKLGLTRSPEADPAILVRRLFLDLTGLPPTPKELEAYLNISNGDAYENLVDDLLARPAFGEHRARYWLDAARYADTHGLHLDNYREMWPYRDWVISAFNQNMPFDQFTVEQIAGDLLPDPSQDQLIATGFNRCNVTTSEGGAIEEEFLVRYAVDRVATTSTVWMGLTAGCAQCHDHKFDPITMKDFYSLYAFFNNTTQPGMDGNAKDSRPVIRVYDSSEIEAEATALNRQISAKEKKAQALIKEARISDLNVAAIRPDEDSTLQRLIEEGKAGAFSKGRPFTIAFRYKLPATEGRVPLLERVDPTNQDRGWRVYWENKSLFVELIESHPNRRLKTGITRRVGAGSSGHLAVVYDGSGNSNGIHLYTNGARISSRFQNTWLDTLVDDFATANGSLQVGGNLASGGEGAQVSELILDDRFWSDAEVKTIATIGQALKIEKSPADKRKKADTKLLTEFLLTHSDGPYQKILDEISDLRSRLSQIESHSPTTMVMEEKADTAAKAHMLLRGEYDQKAEEVTAAFPAFLPQIDDNLPKNRLGLAQWLVHPDHPLTARVTVNRIWQELFGTGLVKTSEDFGTQGENPSHPELLDYLAAMLIESGWDVKALYREIVLSETYRQSSRISEDMAKQDPENRLLARGPRFRLDAEVIRDQALHVSGLLDTSMGGSGVRPYQPAGIWKTVGYSNSNTQTFFQDYGPDAEHRRSIYTFWKRTAHAPNLAIFDAPNREICIMRRERTNTPLQALVMMNDPQFFRASRHLAKRVLTAKTERDDRIDLMGILLRGHPFTEKERTVVINSFDQFRNIYESDPVAAKEVLQDEVNDSFSIASLANISAPEFAAWAMVANQLLNLDESLNKN